MSCQIISIKRYLTILFFFPLLLINGYAQDVKFSEFVIEDGLTSVNTILIDEYGYKWFGGTHGLYKYDGYEFEIFKHTPDYFHSLSSNDITTLFEDNSTNIWIGMSNNGVNVFERKTERLIRLSDIPRLAVSTVTALEQDRKGNIWIGTLKNGIFVLNNDYSLKRHYLHNILDSASLSDNDVFDFLIDTKDNFWIVTNSGSLDLYQPDTDNFVQYTFYPKMLSGIRSGQKLLEAQTGEIWVGTEGQGIFKFNIANSSFEVFIPQGNSTINTNIITGLGKDSKDNVWISTDGGGLNCYNLQSGTYKHYRYDEADEFSISNNSFYSLLIDKSDRVWLGMGTGKVNISNNHPFHFIREGQGISFNVVVDLLIDQRDRLWIASGGGGLDIFDLKNEQFVQNLNTNNENLLKTNILLSLYEDKAANIWAGTFLGGLNKIATSGKIQQRFAHTELSNSLSNDHIFDIAADEAGKIWLATQGGGIDCFDPISQTFKNYSVENNSGLVSNRVQSLLIDNKNRIWAGHFFGGLQLFVTKNDKFASIELPNALHQKMSDYPIHAIYQDHNKNILICTGGMGLVVLDSTFQHYSIYNEKIGLPSNAVYGVIDYQDNYWVCTNRGLARISRKEQEILVIDKSDGLITNDFEAGTMAVSSRGELVLGSKEGIVYFQPELLNEQPEYPELVFTDLVVLNQAVKPGDTLSGKILLEKSLLFSEYIQLPYTQNSFSLSFACPEFEKPQKLFYRYQLKGWEDRWIIAKADRRFLSYTNVDFGEYQLVVQVSIDGGKNWLSEKKIQVIVSPPFYHTKLAYSFYFLLLCGLLYVIYQIIKGRIALRNQLKFEKFSREKDNELNREKINFFTGISHEIRTPLTLILGHLERLSNFDNLEHKLRHELSIINKNGSRLLMLINQLLDFRKMETGQLTLKVSCQDINNIIKEIILPFRELAIQKDIQLQFISHLSEPMVYFDASKIELILYNLLSNALKFTPAYGRIEIVAEVIEEKLLLSVVDTGQGIDIENIEKIFEPFFQGNVENRLGLKGTGIGLSLVKEVVAIHHGQISVESVEKKGATFKVYLPINSSEYAEHEIVDLKEKTMQNLVLNAKSVTTVEKENIAVKLLIVEDNAEILSFLADGFQKEYEVITAMDGKVGLEKALTTIPDLIISDVMMPEMDGIEMCRHLKNDIRTNHIPIILLTARTGFIHEHSGLDTGADDYITKPFQFDLLRVRTNNLIENRKRIHKKIRKDFLLEPKKTLISNPNEQFIADVMDLIEKNIDNTLYKVKELARDMGMSHSVLYRKIQALTNLTINAFIKSVRLKKAAQLLQSDAFSIGEVAYRTGFSNPKYFSTCFSTEFGQSPSDYQQKHAVKPSDDNSNLFD